MIRVNLLRNIGMSGSGTTLGATASVGEIVSQDVQRQALIKLVIILVFPALLLVWEKLKVNTLMAEKAQIQQRVDAIESERASFGSAGPRVEKAVKLKEKIQREIKIIRELAKHRLREVKALDQLQSVLPPGTWLREVSISGGKVVLQGHAINEAGITELLTALNGNVFFSMVQPKGTGQDTNPVLGPVTKFEVEFRVGRQEE